MAWAWDFPGGLGLRLPPEEFPIRYLTLAPQGPHPFFVSMGMGIQPPFPVSMEIRTLPLSPDWNPPACLRIFPCSPGLRAVPERSLFPASSQGCCVRTPRWPPSNLLVLFVPDSRSPRCRRRCRGSPRGPSVRLSLLSGAAKCASVRLRKPEQGVGPVPPGSAPSACLWSLPLCLAAPAWEGLLSNPERKRKIKCKAKRKTESGVLMVFKFRLACQTRICRTCVLAGERRITIPDHERFKFSVFLQEDVSLSGECVFPRE